jgi:class 3 adenylate cyclase
MVSMGKNTSEKFNVVLLVLFFIIPLTALNLSYFLFAKINENLEKNEQSVKAIHEVETLSSEADFGIEFSRLFGNFFYELKNAANFNDAKFLVDSLNKKSEKIFEKPFPDYNLFVFKTTSDTKSTELLLTHGNIGTSKKALCLTFEYLYNMNISNNKNKSNDLRSKKVFAQKLLGKFTNTEIIAKEMRGITTFSNGIHKNSWFVWNYYVGDNEEVYGAILLCNVKEDYPEIGRLLALKSLKRRGNAIGAFIPVLAAYGKPTVQSPLDKSRIFNNFANSLTVQNVNNLEKWLKDTLPNEVSLGNYTAFCNLERGATHIAIVLVRAIKKLNFPKWLISINILFILIMAIILFCGIGFGKWPKINLLARFSLSYLLASFLPLILLVSVAYGYIMLYENTSINQAKSDLLSVLKTFDSQKNVSVKEYREAFVKALNDEKIISLTNEKEVDEKLVVNRVLEIFEKGRLPLLGVKLVNENGKGAFVTGSGLEDFDFELLVKSFLSIQVNILRKKMEEDSSDQKFEKYESDDDLANKGYRAILGRDVDGDVTKRLSEPILSKNGDFCSYQIFDVLKINEKAKYMLFVAWDDKTLDDEIISKSISNYNIKNISNNKNRNQNFLAYKIIGQDLKEIGESRHLSQNLSDSINNHAKLVALTKKNDTFVEDDNIVVIMPALSFNQTLFVGWVSKSHILVDLFSRKIVLLILVLLSLTVLWICVIRSAFAFLKPISALKGALDEVSVGNLNVGFNNAPNDELGNLSNEFSKMIDELEEKERLSKLISDHAVQALQKNSSTLINDTETFKGVALVSDIRNFTGMSEKYDPVIITELLNEHFAEMAKIISDKGGLIYKFIGDAIEAVFPEKDDYEESASERAFKAGSMMIDRLSEINNRRKNKDLFTYRIGVGLCYGTMYSGTVGSLETRLDYSILGDPLKKAAKFEALSIQNPDFPIVVGEEIGEKLAGLGVGFKKIDSMGQSFTVYTLVKNNTEENNSFLLDNENKNNTKNEDSENKKERKLFSLFVGNPLKSNYIKLCFNLLYLFFTVSLLACGVGFIISQNHERLKSESEKECSRLIEELQSNDVMKSCFNALCFEFYEDIDKYFKSENKTGSFKQNITKIADKYERLGYPIPKYYCCLFNDFNVEEDGFVSKGFEDKTCDIIKAISVSFLKGKNGYEERKQNISDLFGASIKFYDLRTSLFRRSSMATIADEEMLVDTNKFFDENHKMISYILCGMPKDIVNSSSPSYFTLLTGDSLQLAIKDDDKWYFSKGFSEIDKKILKKYPDSSYLLIKGYEKKDIDINNKKYTIYVITNKLLSSYYPLSLIGCIVFFSIFFLGILILFIRKKKSFLNSTLSMKLNIDILLSALLPIIIVSFVSYLYINENYINKNSEVRSKLNNLIDDIEKRELYFHPLIEKYLNSLPSSNIFRDYINRINNPKNDLVKDEIIKKFKRDIYNEIVGEGEKHFNTDFITNNSKVDINRPSIIKLEPHFRITEMLVIGKNDWVISVNYRLKKEEDYNKKLTDFGKIVYPLFSEIYFKNTNTNDNKNIGSDSDLSSTKKEMMLDELLKAFNSIFGKEFVFKLLNFPNNLVSVVISYSTASFYVSTVYSEENPNNIDAIIFSLIYYDNEFKPSICRMRNNEKPFKQHLYSDSNSENLYCFHSPNVDVGEYFFYSNPQENCDENFPSKLEDFKAVKEFCFVSSFINSSYIPISTNVNIYGNHLLEARQGNHIKDNVYIALASEKPINKERFYYILIFIFILIISIKIINFISKSVINDLLSPIEVLLEGAKSVAQGKYSYRTNFIRGDELGNLCFSFDKMMKGLEEKQLMNRMVSKTALKVASSLVDTDSKKVDVALLYVTVPEFDKNMKDIPPFELFSKLRQQIAVISEIVINNGGDIDKIMGEKMLIAFRSDDKSSEEVAVNASKVASLIETSEKLSFNVAVGVNYGQVISGYLGVGEKRDFTIIGDPVNVTARIAVFAEKLESNRLVVSEDVKKLIEKYIKTEEYGEVLFKGKSQPAKVYRIL